MDIKCTWNYAGFIPSNISQAFIVIANSVKFYFKFAKLVNIAMSDKNVKIVSLMFCDGLWFLRYMCFLSSSFGEGIENTRRVG